MNPQRLPIHWKNVDINAPLCPHTVVTVAFYQKRSPVSHLGVKEKVVFIRRCVLQRHRFGQFLWQYFHQSPIIVPQHLDIQVVIPRNEAMMTHRAYQCSAAQPILYIVFFTNAVYFQKNLKHSFLLAAQQRTRRIEPRTQFFGCIMFFFHVCFY